MIELPQYDCIRIDSEITVDGTLTDDAWESADVIQLLTTDTGEKPRHPTEVRLVWNSEYLYVGFLCYDQDIW